MGILKSSDNMVVFWKILEEGEFMDDLIERIRSSTEFDQEYKLNTDDVAQFNGAADGTVFPFVVLIYGLCKDAKTKENVDVVREAYAGKATLGTNGSDKIFTFNAKQLNIDLTARNICGITQINLQKDFTKGRYLLVENSAVVADQVRSYINDPKASPQPKKLTAPKTKAGVQRHPLAAREEDCVRICEDMPCFEKDAPEYRRDVIAITNSRAFRRTVDKAQLFGASKGDYYRTRMTHTQVVTQIALAICDRLNLNRDLTEAIALAHDIGHTPFGHQGERTLDAILRGDGYDIIMNPELLGKGFGFKHNYQSVRVASLEETRHEYEGLNLSMQTLEGMLKHTGLKPDKYDLKYFTDIPAYVLHTDNDFADTLEGQIAAIADEIAQRAHDLDDALLSGEFTLEEFLEYMKLSRNTNFGAKIEAIIDELRKTMLDGFRPDDETRLIVGEIASEFTGYFIDETVNASLPEMDNDAAAHVPGSPITKQYIKLSDEAQRFNDYLAKLITGRAVTNNPNVALFDNNAEAVIAGLFKAYYDNPRILPVGTKRRIYKAMRAATADPEHKKAPNVIDFETGDSDTIRAEFIAITEMDLRKPANKKAVKAKLNYVNGFDILTMPDGADETEVLNNLLDQYTEKRRILVRGICDYIGAMTDSYAMNEYERIVQNNAKK